MRATLTAIAVVSLAFAGCGDDDATDDNNDSDIEERTEQFGARSAAEGVRADLRARDLTGEENLRDIEVLEDATGNIPGDPEIVGLEDTTGDGRDDDGLVEILVGDEAACLEVGEDDDTVDVSGGNCG